jgi:hypothetical protein
MLNFNVLIVVMLNVIVVIVVAPKSELGKC